MDGRDYLADLLGNVPEWQARALCAQTDPEAFFPEKGGSTRDAKRICARCEVKENCLNYALDHDERFGIWGGLSERERRKIKRQAREAARRRTERLPVVVCLPTPMINPAVAAELAFAQQLRHAEPVLVAEGQGRLGLMDELVGAHLGAPEETPVEEPAVHERVPVAA
ncbi:Transcription factor WhiB [Glycomyces harbinensis]|uniref:Transcriptional regulator WhiB n=1 Tax=Glycomyces harbinensis TaxID=58114 RepID=A0A1G6USA2_9ACTN|nr:WhiB family transcriptional regulator [Glycomyces harbinensis]SDD43596.1 Transcription factor WhiB [Glycomyces harbinensis]